MKKMYFFISIIISYYLFCVSYNFNSNNSGNFIYPTDYTSISSEYGNRILYGTNNFHNGIDFLAPQGSKIYASNSGYVEYASFLESGYGNTIIICHDSNIKTLYCHVSENFVVKVGDYVFQGDVIGYVGPKYLSNGIMNGNSTGPHLHFSVFLDGKTLNPLEVLEAK